MERKTKHDLRSEATREQLMAAARPLFAARGYAAVGTEEIVRAAGVTRGALYHQFRDKAELFAAVVEQLEAEVTAGVAQGAIGAGDPLAELRAGTRMFLQACSEPEVERILLLDAPAVLGWERWREVSARHGLGLLRGALEAAMAEGLIASGPALPLAHMLMSAIDEGAMYVSRAADAEAARAEVAAVVDHLLDGLRAQPS
jgi:AcrR family transcriptional regulator